MAYLINKDALVAEIERRRNDYINSFMTEQVHMLNNVLDFIDTLEVKEVDSNDAFIEKACGWLKESITNNPECNRIISKKGVITMGELIEDFRKYMGK